MNKNHPLKIAMEVCRGISIAMTELKRDVPPALLTGLQGASSSMVLNLTKVESSDGNAKMKYYRNAQSQTRITYNGIKVLSSLGVFDEKFSKWAFDKLKQIKFPS